jgi:2-dehydro-3-deoxyphosphogluconate aldolase/(4S)-4-hydroxy-2-oxoglutarate aldolase
MAGIWVYAAVTPDGKLDQASLENLTKARDLGSAAVKIFPARQLGPVYLKDLQGPYPGIRLLPSGGIDASNARSYLDAGAAAVCCGTSVVPPAAVAAGDWADITARAIAFTGVLK